MSPVAMSPLEHVIRNRRGKTWEQMKALTERVVAQNRVFTQEEDLEWRHLDSQMQALDAALKSELARTAAQRRRAEMAANGGLQPQPNYNRQAPPRRLPAGCWQLLGLS